LQKNNEELSSIQTELDNHTFSDNTTITGKANKIANIITELKNKNTELSSIQTELNNHTFSDNTNITNKKDKIANIITQLQKKDEELEQLKLDCKNEKLAEKTKFANDLDAAMKQNEDELNATKTDLQKKTTELSNLTIRLNELSQGGIDSKIVHLNNLFSTTQDFAQSLKIDSNKFREDFNTVEKRKKYLIILYRWSSLKMLNTIDAITTSSVYEKYTDIVKYSPEDFINALFLFTISFQVGLSENLLY
jgi:chromosome segregation ATPase